MSTYRLQLESGDIVEVSASSHAIDGQGFLYLWIDTKLRAIFAPGWVALEILE